MEHRKKRNGFSEIEVGTFIILIAVITVLVRSCGDKLHVNEIQKDIVKITEYKNAVTQFQTKYGQLPGDYIKAKETFAGCEDMPDIKATCNGNADGFWDNRENLYVFEHLSKAGMLDDKYISNPQTMTENIYPIFKMTGQSIVPIGAMTAVEQQNISDMFFGYKMPQNSFLVYFESNVPGDTMIPTQQKVETRVVQELDKKLDDGVGSKGNIRAAFDRSNFFGAYKRYDQCVDKNGAYIDDEDNKYYCSFIVKY